MTATLDPRAPPVVQISRHIAELGEEAARLAGSARTASPAARARLAELHHHRLDQLEQLIDLLESCEPGTRGDGIAVAQLLVATVALEALLAEDARPEQARLAQQAQRLTRAALDRILVNLGARQPAPIALEGAA